MQHSRTGCVTSLLYAAALMISACGAGRLPYVPGSHPIVSSLRESLTREQAIDGFDDGVPCDYVWAQQYGAGPDNNLSCCWVDGTGIHWSGLRAFVSQDGNELVDCISAVCPRVTFVVPWSRVGYVELYETATAMWGRVYRLDVYHEGDEYAPELVRDERTTVPFWKTQPPPTVKLLLYNANPLRCPFTKMGRDAPPPWNLLASIEALAPNLQPAPMQHIEGTTGKYKIGGRYVRTGQ